jgi:hypothetical protein
MSSQISYEKVENPTDNVQPQDKRKTSKLLFKLSGWPAFVMAGHIALQAFAWTFFVVVERRGVMPAPHWLASSANMHPQIVTLVATLLSTALAACSSL